MHFKVLFIIMVVSIIKLNTPNLKFPLSNNGKLLYTSGQYTKHPNILIRVKIIHIQRKIISLQQSLKVQKHSYKLCMSAAGNQ